MMDLSSARVASRLEVDTQHDADRQAPNSTSPKKRKRSRKGDSEKKFDCKHEGCGKSYSRAEHLYRHQLNHNPKEIYHCGFANCYRTFVRQDLCLRHRERHNTHGSQLQKRDSFPYVAGSTAPQSSSAERVDGQTASQAGDITPAASPTDGRTQLPPLSPTATKGRSTTTHNYLDSKTTRSAASSSTASVDPHFQPPTPQTAVFAAPDPQPKQQRSNSTGGGGNSSHFPNHAAYRSAHQPPYTTANYHGERYHRPSFGSSDSTASAPNPSPILRRHMSASGPSGPASHVYISSTDTTATHDPARPAKPSTYGSQPNLHISSTQPSATTDVTMGGQVTSASIAPVTPNGFGQIDPVSGLMDPAAPDMDTLAPYAMPVFGEESLNRAPFSMGEAFTNWLFNESVATSSLGYPSVTGIMSSYSEYAPLQNQFYDTTMGGFYVVQPQQPSLQQLQQQDPMSVTSILDSDPLQTMMSDDKRSELLYVMQTRFNEADNAGVKTSKSGLLDGNEDADNHVLSPRMMQAHIQSFWQHCHQQLPILHKPTFKVDKAPNLLLLSVIALGAATLGNEYGRETIKMAGELAKFIAWHLRWEIFQHADFQPPAKLWVFQSLLLLETFEKMYSTREMHERAHIHHDTTLTLMRRGSSLIGRSSFDSSPSNGLSAPEDRRSRSVELGIGEESWAQWIKTEATLRAAFAAFVLDSIHATMFGHSAKMVAHEMRLHLPCDEALWSATSAAEVARVQASLNSNGVRPTIFLDGLKKTLNGQRVRTNSFGRTIIMAGLLSVSWHMNQRDLQVSSLGASQVLGGNKWRSALLRAFDFWKRDFDESVVHPSPSSAYSPAYRQQFSTEEDVFFECRTVFHHLAHMASHVDIVDCQIFAGAGRLLGRSITLRDYSAARDKMTQRWATRASARDAAFYALKFLSQVLLPEDYSSGNWGQHKAYVEYAARDDQLFNRPWVIYYATLVVWCYGYALDGPITPQPAELKTNAEQQRDMFVFLDSVGGVRTPNDLEQISGRNRCLGLLLVLKRAFANTRWELLVEASNLLRSCINMLKGISPPAAAVGTPAGIPV